MNKENLDAIIQTYLTKFDNLNDVNGNNESYKWKAQNCFSENWDINARDFTKMFNAAMKETSNLIDGGSIQPLGGIRELLKQGEDEFVRESFRMLFAEDGGNLEERQQRIEKFINQVNAKIEHYAKGSWRYPQTLAATIYYLNLWKPNENYIYKYTEATEWANCIEYGDDFGSGTTFSLKKYYKMCDELQCALSNYPELLTRHNTFELRKLNNVDDNLHILVYDIIYCAYQYGFYSAMPIEKMSKNERLTRAALRDKKEKLELSISKKEKQLEELESLVHELPDIMNLTVRHKVYGKGIIFKIDEMYLTVKFEEIEKKFVYPNAILDGFLLLENTALNEQFIKYAQANNKISNLKEELQNLSAAYRLL